MLLRFIKINGIFITNLESLILIGLINISNDFQFLKNFA
jgi:hypothetical protein